MYQALLVGLMFLQNQVVYIQFHPVVYMIKLNIEMSMASLVVRLAQGKTHNDMDPEEFHSTTDPASHSRSAHHGQRVGGDQIKSIQLSSRSNKRAHDAGLGKIDSDESLGGIECRTELNVVVEEIDSAKSEYRQGSSSRSSREAKPYSVFEDETPLHKNTVRVQERVM